MEPLPAVELNNDIVSLQDEERQEVVRILQGLTARVGDRADELARASEILGELDAVQAMALLARDMDARRPGDRGRTRGSSSGTRAIPLLMPNLAERLGIDRRSHARAGARRRPRRLRQPGARDQRPQHRRARRSRSRPPGSSRSWRSAGSTCPPGKAASLPVFQQVYADIGDEQSIAANLSTFSAHLATIVEMTRDLEAPSLVLLDEVGAGTDPTEGGALGVAIVDYFRRAGRWWWPPRTTGS